MGNLVYESSLVIANGAQVSGSLQIDPSVPLVGVLIPTLTSCNLTLEVSRDGTTWFGLYQDDGSQWILSGTTGNFAMPIPAAYPFDYIRARSSVNQGADRTFWFTGRG